MQNTIECPFNVENEKPATILAPSVTSKMWEDYFEIKNRCRKSERGKNAEYITARNRLIEYYYANFVCKIANAQALKLKNSDRDELASSGIDGLMDAIESYDLSRKTKFETFATLRVIGSMLDNIRKNDWVPRLTRQRASALDKIRQNLESEEGRFLEDREVAEKLGFSFEDFLELVRKSTPVSQYSITSTSDETNDMDLMESMEFPVKEESVESDYLKKEMFQKLLGKNFTVLERKIIYMKYYENMNMKEISDHVGFSESRISQLHGDILRRLREKIKRNPVYGENLSEMLLG